MMNVPARPLLDISRSHYLQSKRTGCFGFRSNERRSLERSHLLDGAADRGEHIACVRPNKADCTYHNDENDGQHDGILSDVLPFVI
jgi:hypothetical protein